MFQKILLALAIIAGIAFISWLKGWWIPNRPDPARYPIRGIDVSHHNGIVDWEKVKRSGIEFAFIKATEGSDWQDVRLKNNWTEAQKAGIRTGGYHYFSTTSSGESQARNFVATVPADKGSLPPVIDVEFSKSRSRMTEDQFHRELGVMMEILRGRYGTEPIIYTTEEFHGNYFRDKKIERLWAREVVALFPNWGRHWLFWQYSSRGRIRGIEGRVDLNVFRGTRDEFKELLVR